MKEDFLKYQAQTSPNPLALEVSHASGSFIYDKNGKAYLDFVAGVSACTLGHSHPKILKAVKDQMQRYTHVMVYGEYIQEAPVALAKLLAEQLPQPLDSTYLVNSGTEAIEGALKLARKLTGRVEMVYAEQAYHGNTMGSLSIMGTHERKTAFEPLMENCQAIPFNNLAALGQITSTTAAVVLETIQGGAGFIEPHAGYLIAVKQRCEQVGALLILDEIQTGFGRTGKLFGFEHYDVVPDILVTGKGLGGGFPIGAFTASKAHMSELTDPKLSHITTFGGHPVIAAAGLATLKEVLDGDYMQTALAHETLIRELLTSHPSVKEIRGRGLMLALMVDNPELASKIILKCQERGLILFWLLFEGRAIRLTPPLTISEKEIRDGCAILSEVMDDLS